MVIITVIKGIGFFSSPSNHLAYTDFNQLLSVYSFDMQVKAILYTPLMQIETALKNYALEEFLLECDSCHFADIYTNILNHHNDFQKGSSGFKEAIKKELSFRNKIYGDLSRDYSAKLVVQHFMIKINPFRFGPSLRRSALVILALCCYALMIRLSRKSQRV